MREAIIQKVIDKKIIAIVRGVYEEDCLNLARALYKGGIELLEFTFDHKLDGMWLKHDSFLSQDLPLDCIFSYFLL